MLFDGPAGCNKLVRSSLSLSFGSRASEMAIILVVEDEAPTLTLAVLALKKLGHETISARSAEEAQAVIHSDQKVDLVFTDIVLPDHEGGGLTLAQLAGRLRAGMPVLYTSGHAVTDTIRAQFVQPSAFLQKPYTAQALANAVAGLLDSRA